jgi:hypothetical protein
VLDDRDGLAYNLHGLSLELGDFGVQAEVDVHVDVHVNVCHDGCRVLCVVDVVTLASLIGESCDSQVQRAGS